MMLLLFWFAALSASFWVPPIQYGLRRVDWTLCRGLAVLLIFLPGTAIAVFLTHFGAIIDDSLTWISVCNRLIGPIVGVTFRCFWAFTGFNLLLWGACSFIIRRQCRSRCIPYVRTPRRALFASVVIVLILTGAPTFYLYNYKTLEDAVERGDLALAEKRLKFNLLGVDANTGCITKVSSHDTEAGPLLPRAAERGDLEMAKFLVEHGADLNRCGEWISSPICVSVCMDHYDVAKYLLDQGADPNLAVRAAAAKKRTDFLQLILAHGASPSLGLRDAVNANTFENLQLLIDHGATPLGIDSQGRTLLDIAGAQETDACFRLLSQYTHDIRYPHGFIEYGTVSTLEQALSFGMDPNAEYRGAFGKTETLLAHAIRLNRQEFVDTLLKAGARLTIRTPGIPANASRDTFRRSS
ncbi:MAG: ankyrin repeat domain-containing protein [Candidatus Hydrogenedentales bacterium]